MHRTRDWRRAQTEKRRAPLRRQYQERLTRKEHDLKINLYPWMSTDWYTRPGGFFDRYYGPSALRGCMKAEGHTWKSRGRYGYRNHRCGDCGPRACDYCVMDNYRKVQQLFDATDEDLKTYLAGGYDDLDGEGINQHTLVMHIPKPPRCEWNYYGIWNH